MMIRIFGLAAFGAGWCPLGWFPDRTRTVTIGDQDRDASRDLAEGEQRPNDDWPLDRRLSLPLGLLQ
jgi:hypothetical protein